MRQTGERKGEDGERGRLNGWQMATYGWFLYLGPRAARRPCPLAPGAARRPDGQTGGGEGEGRRVEGLGGGE